jgi:hypothetical protein
MHVEDLMPTWIWISLQAMVHILIRKTLDLDPHRKRLDPDNFLMHVPEVLGTYLKIECLPGSGSAFGKA